MDRGVVYQGQIPFEQDWLYPQRSALIALGKLSEAVLGTQTAIDGLTVVPTAPASMSVRVDAGQIYQQASVDATAYGILPADTAHQIVKQGLMMDPLTIPLSAPGTPGFSQWFLIQCAFQEQEGGSFVLPYYNSANPTVPYSGPNNSGAPQYTQRNGRIVVQVKAGAPATTGSQPLPNADPGWTGLAWVSLANGQTTIQTSHIFRVKDTRRAPLKLPDIGLSFGSKATFVRSNYNLSVEEMGLVVIDLDTFFGPIVINLPRANALGNGVPLRVTFAARHDAPTTTPNNMPYAHIKATGGDAIDFANAGPGIYCGPEDTVSLMSDGISRWYWVNQHKSALALMTIAGGAQTIPSGVLTAVTFAAPPAIYYPAWTAADPTKWTAPAWMRIRASFGVEFESNATGLRYAAVVMNGQQFIHELPTARVPPCSGSPTIVSVAGGLAGIQMGQFLQLHVYQNSGVPLSVSGGMHIEVAS